MANRKLPVREKAQTAGAKAVSDVVAPAATGGLDLDRTTLVIPKSLRTDVERRLLEVGRRVSFSGVVEAALRELLAGDAEAILDRWDARARRVGP